MEVRWGVFIESWYKNDRKYSYTNSYIVAISAIT